MEELADASVVDVFVLCITSRAICCDVAVALRIISCMCCFHCSCLCRITPRYLYVFTIMILNDDNVSVNVEYALGNVRLL